VAGQALKGPAAKIMRELGDEPSSLAVAQFYQGLVDMLVVDHADSALAAAIAAMGIRPIVTNTIMKVPQDRAALARRIIESAGSPTRLSAEST